jgi:iron complex outermembrane receptor protein
MKNHGNRTWVQTGKAIGFAIAALLLLFLTPSQATSVTQDQNNPLKTLTLEQLGNVEVTSVSKQPELVYKTAAAIYVITQDDIRRSGATTIPAALRLAPGVEVARIDSNKWSIGIRGFGSNLSRDVLVLIDGRTVYSTLLAGTYWNVQNVVMEDVDRIEVIRGPGGTVWGPNAVNGVINIITKSSKDTQGVMVSAGGGNTEQGFLNVRYGGSDTANGLNYRVYGMGFYRGPEYHSDGLNYDRWRNIQGGFRTDWQRSARDTVTVQGDIYDERAGEIVTATSYTPPYSQMLDGNARLSGGNILARWSRDLGNGNNFQLQAFYDRTNRREPNFIDLRSTYDVDFIDRVHLPWRQQLSWGAGVRFSVGDNPEVVSGLTFAPTKRTDKLFTAFIQDDIGLIENKFTFSIGTKLVRTNFVGVQFEPNARLLWTPTANQSLWVAFTQAVRTPSDAERNFALAGFIGLTPSGTPFFARFNPNPNFRSEELDGYEAGYRRALAKNVYIDVAVFYNRYSDLFSEDVTGAPYVENNPPPTHILLPAQFGNDLLGTTKGVEFAPEWKPASFWRLRASYSYLQMNIRKARNSEDIGSSGSIDGSSPRHEATAQSQIDFAKKFSFNLTYRFVGRLSSEVVPSYSTGDAHFSWQLNREVQLSVVGQNLFQPHHFESAGDPGPLVGIKRDVYGQITWRR